MSGDVILVPGVRFRRLPVRHVRWYVDPIRDEPAFRQLVDA